MPACARPGVYVPRQTHDCDAAVLVRRHLAGFLERLAESGHGPLPVVVVHVHARDHRSVRAFFSTDLTMDVVQLLEIYAGRWSLEVKQELGFGESQARKRAAVERTAPFVGYSYTVLVLWYAEGAHQSPLACPPLRPWYRHKDGHSFADILRCAQTVDVLAILRAQAPANARAGPTNVRMAA